MEDLIFLFSLFICHTMNLLLLSGWKHIKCEPFLFKKRWCITNIIVYSKLKSRWHPLVILNMSKKLLNLHNNIFELEVHFHPTVRWGRLDKINVHRVYNLQFFSSHRASCLWFMKHYQTKENWKNNAIPIYKISSSLIW
jgi:hypothetical protein